MLDLVVVTVEAVVETTELVALVDAWAAEEVDETMDDELPEGAEELEEVFNGAQSRMVESALAEAMMGSTG